MCCGLSECHIGVIMGAPWLFGDGGWYDGSYFITTRCVGDTPAVILGMRKLYPVYSVQLLIISKTVTHTFRFHLGTELCMVSARTSGGRYA